MSPRGMKTLLMLALSFAVLPQVATAQREAAGVPLQQTPCADAHAAGPVALHAALRGAPYLSLCDGQALASALASPAEIGQGAQPLSLTQGDFDEDGVPDLVTGFAAGQGGIVKVYRGNVQALWPYGAAIQNGAPAAFLPGAKTLGLPERPDFIGAGDFNADGHWDIVAAAFGGNTLYFLPGNGHGGFGAAQAVGMPGAITAMATGEINRADGLTDIVVGVNNGGVAEVLVLEAPNGAMRAKPEVFDVPAPVTALALGHLDGGPMSDLAIAAGRELLLVHGRDRKLSMGESARNSVPEANITRQMLPFSVHALAVGSFSGLSNLAALGDDGAVHLLENNQAVANLARRASEPDFLLKGDKAKSTLAPASAAGQMTRRQAQVRLAAQRKPAKTASNSAGGSEPEWSLRESVALPQSAAAGGSPSGSLLTAHLTSAPADDLLVVDSAASQIHLLANTAARDSASRGATSADSVAQEAMTHLTSFDVSGSPAAVLPMRLNQHPLQGLVVLASGQNAPIVAVTTPPYTQVVTNTAKSGAGSLEAAIENMDSNGVPAAINFNIPASDPNCDAYTHVCTIYVESTGTGNCNDTALPALYVPVTIDGYTQPGSSPNTLASGDNAVVLIRVDGNQTTVAGGEGFDIFEVAATIRGLNVAGFNKPDSTCGLSGGKAVGALGIDMEGLGDFAEGNFVGTNANASGSGLFDMNTGALGNDDNAAGVFVGNGPALGLLALGAGNVVGGTTPQARNVISGNSVGVETYAEVDMTQIEGNFIGTDRTGTQAVGNLLLGVFASEYTTIGGTTPGAGNLLSGNTTNFGTNGSGYGTFDLVQGNLIGTDVTGTHAVGGGGIAVYYNYEYLTIGGTTPAARNVISGNFGPGISFDSVWNNLVQGNYIGVDVTGSTALRNTQQGIVSNNASFTWFGSTTPVTTLFPAFLNTIGGATPGAGNVISGNIGDGISIAGSTWDYEGIPASGIGTLEGNTIQGNLIGTDATGANPIPNGGNGIHMIAAATVTDAAGDTLPTNNIMGGSVPGEGNVISNNKGDGVLIEAGSGNNTLLNVIQNNTGAGVHITGGNGNLISRNSIYGNGALGIELGTAQNPNNHCQADATGPNNLQNTPVLTAGSGTTFLSATATDPNGNTSEFSNTVNVSGSVLNALGTFDGLPGTTFTVEFFSSPTADASGFGQGQTYLGSTTVTTPSTCDIAVNDPIDTTQADMSVTLAATPGFTTGPELGAQSYSSTVTNNGAATAHNVVWTNQLPAGITIANTSYASCVSPVTTSLGSCTVSSNLVTCNLGTMPAGSTASITIPVETNTAGSLTDTASVTATEPDPNLANNTASVTNTAKGPLPIPDHLQPAAVIAGGSDLTLLVYGSNFLPTTTIQFNGTALPVTAFYDNQSCYFQGSPFRCEAVQVVVPAAMLATAGDATIVAANGTTVSFSYDFPGFIQSSCQYTVSEFPGLSYGNEGGVITLITDTNAPSCSWTASPVAPWLTTLDPTLATGGSDTGNVEFDVFAAQNSGAAQSGNYTDAGQTVTFQEAGGASCIYTLDTTSATLPGTTGGGTINVTASPQTCSWAVQPYGNWISVPTSVSTNSIGVTGNAPFSYTVSANPGATRTGWMTIDGALFTITQNPATSCYFTLDSSSSYWPTSGGSGSFGIIASQPSCPWSASVNQPFVTVTSPTSGTGNGTITFNVAANAASAQSAAIMVGNQAGASVSYSISQASADICSFTLTPNTVSFSSEGGSNSFNLSQSYAFCHWTAQSNDPDALLLNSPTGTGTTSEPYGYFVTQNPGSARVLTATVGCQTLTVNQDGVGAGNPVPTITTLQPASTPVGTTSFTLTVNGTNFISGSTVLFNGLPRVTTFVSATQLTAAILDRDIDTAGTATITVSTPEPGGGVSNAVTFTVSGQNPVPAITALLPASAQAGAGAFTLTVTGTGFDNSSVVSFAGTARATTYVSATQLTIPVLAADVATGGTFTVLVTNPPPGGGPSNSVALSVTNPAPVLTSLSPTSGAVGTTAVLTLNGANFNSESVVNFNGIAQTTIYAGSSFFILAAATPDTAGTVNVTVSNPAPGGGTSAALPFTVSGTNAAPTATSLQPTSAIAGGAGFTLTVTGTNFLSGSVVNFNGSPRATMLVSGSNGTQVAATILAGDIANGSSASISVTNPAPGGGTSNALAFPINNPIPVITALQPPLAAAGSGQFTLTVNGSNFTSGSVVKFNGNARVTTFVSASQLTAVILAGDVATVGTPSVTVTNPAPGGGTSGAAVFNVTANNPVPAITTLSPTSATAGSGAFTLTVNGSNFVSSSVVNFNGSARTTTFVSSTKITAAILAGDVASVGTPSVTVTNPAPGGGTSSAVTFNVTAANNPVPAITALAPTGASAGSGAFTLTVNGSGFVNSSVVNFNGSARTTTFVSSTKITAAILAGDVASVGTPSVTVTNPAPGGGTSNAVTFNVTAADNPVPAITTLSPTGATAGSGAFTLTVNGSGFVNSSVVNFNGSARTTTFVNATIITAAILAGDVASVGTAAVTVTNPAPGGGTSNAVTFNVTPVPNPVPAIASLGPAHSPAGAAFTLTVTGNNFLLNSSVSFNGKNETVTFVSATQLTVAIPAGDASTGGTVPVTVTNPAPGGGTSPASDFTLDDYSVSGPSGAVNVVRGGAPVTITISLAPTADGFANPVQLTLSGLASGLTAQFTQPVITPGSNIATTTLTITASTTAQLGPIAPRPQFPGAPLGLLAVILPGGLIFARKRGWRTLGARWTAPVLWLVLLGGMALSLTGCGGGFSLGNSNNDVLTVTATSGTDQHKTQIRLNIQ